jgi:hypothetical protein
MGHVLAIMFAKRELGVFLGDIDRGKLDQARDCIKLYLEFSFMQGLVKESLEAVPFYKNILLGRGGEPNYYTVRCGVCVFLG